MTRAQKARFEEAIELLLQQCGQLKDYQIQLNASYDVLFDRDLAIESMKRWHSRTHTILATRVGGIDAENFRRILPMLPVSFRGFRNFEELLSRFHGFLVNLINDIEQHPTDPAFDTLLNEPAPIRREPKQTNASAIGDKEHSPMKPPKPQSAKRVQVPERIQAEVLEECRRRCCLCYCLDGDANEQSGQIAHIDGDRGNSSKDNLAFLCLKHHAKHDSASRIAKGTQPQEIRKYRKLLCEAVADGRIPGSGMIRDIIPFPGTTIMTNGDGNNIFSAGRGINVTIKSKGRTVIAPPPDSVGADADMRAYINYLNDRYVDLRNKGISAGIDKRSFFAGILHKLIQKHFGRKTNLVSRDYFDDLVRFMQNAIDGTIWGKNSPNRNYHSFEEHRAMGDGRRKKTHTLEDTGVPEQL